MKRLATKLHGLAKSRFTGAGIDLVLVALIYLIGQLGVMSVINAYRIQTNEELYARPSVLVTAYIVGGVLSLAGTLLILHTRKMNLRDIALGKPKLRDIGYGVIGFGVYFLVVRIVLVVLDAAVPALNVNQAQDIGLKNLSTDILPAAFVALAVLPPLSEELLFRGFLFTRLRGYNFHGALSALVVSAAFGAMHGQWNVAIDTFVLSMVMIYTMQYRRSLWVSIAMHAIKNTLAFMALFIFKIV